MLPPTACRFFSIILWRAFSSSAAQDAIALKSPIQERRDQRLGVQFCLHEATSRLFDYQLNGLALEQEVDQVKMEVNNILPLHNFMMLINNRKYV
jgi:hypothetical protein